VSGQIVGSFGLASDPNLSHAFSYSNGKMTDLGTLGGTNSYAYSINDFGQIVGDSNFAGNSGYLGFLYSDGVIRDLKSVLDASGNGWTIEGASDINNNGWIAAGAFNSAVARSDAVLLIPVPESSSFVNVVGAMALDAIIRQWRPRC
jgi:probable HAF family extracellular repeat protein